MALNETQQWWVRTDGDDLNGGGYDAAISSPGTNYSDQASAHVTFNGSSVTATTSGTSATITITGYTVASTDVANVVHIASGTNFTAGWYAITSVNVGASTWTLDRNCSSGAGSAMVGRMGGAWAGFGNIDTGGTPVIAGNIINIRGTGSTDPSSADYTFTSYFGNLPSGNIADRIQLVGYNGRPRLDRTGGNLLFYTSLYWRIDHLKVVINGSDFPTLGIFAVRCTIHDCIIDIGGQDVQVAIAVEQFTSNKLTNSGSTGAGSYAALAPSVNPDCLLIMGNKFENYRGWIVSIVNARVVFLWNLVVGCCHASKGAVDVDSSGGTYTPACEVIGNTFDLGAADGVRFADVNAFSHARVLNNIFSNCSRYGQNVDFGTAAANALIGAVNDYNDYYNNTSGARNNLSAGAHDLALDPQYTDAANGNYTIGTNLRAKGFPLAPLGT